MRPLASPEETAGPASAPEPEETTPEPEPRHASKTPSEPASSDARENSQLAAQLMRQQQLSVQNIQLIESRVGQMADSVASTFKQMTEALEVMKATADLLHEFLASLNEQTERLTLVAAALIQYSQEQAAMQASGGNQPA